MELKINSTQNNQDGSQAWDPDDQLQDDVSWGAVSAQPHPRLTVKSLAPDLSGAAESYRSLFALVAKPL